MMELVKWDDQQLYNWEDHTLITGGFLVLVAFSPGVWNHPSQLVRKQLESCGVILQEITYGHTLRGGDEAEEKTLKQGPRDPRF